MIPAYVAFAAGIAITAYILFGYPLLLAWFPWTFRPPVRKDSRHQASVSIVLAVYNGAGFLRAKLESILSLEYPDKLRQILVLSDGSTDDTCQIAEEFADRGVTLVRLPHGGKATAVNHALTLATGEILFFTDVRQPLDRMALAHLVANFADPTVGAVTGEMRLFKPDSAEQADMDLYWRYEVWARKIHSRIDSIFASTGCIFAIRRSLAQPIPSDTLSDDAILPLRAFLRGYRVILDPEALATDYPAADATEFRRRCRNLAGLWQTFVRLPQLFGSRDRMRLHFLSHKFSRLALPWTLLLIVGASLALPKSTFRSVVLVLEALFLMLAAVDYWIPSGAVKRITSPARTFLTMNVASLAALRVFFGSANRLWIPTRVK